MSFQLVTLFGQAFGIVFVFFIECVLLRFQTLVPGRDVTVWRARYVPADAGGPDGAKSLGEGAGDPAFDEPGRGTWTVEVAVEFGTAVGTASYFWRLKVE